MDDDLKAMNQSPLTSGIHHLGLTVSDIQQAAAFFCEQLNYTVVGGQPDYPATFVSDGHIMLTLWQLSPEGQAAFDRHRHIGLHHVALKIVNSTKLEQLYLKLAKLAGVEFEFPPEPLGQTGAMHMMCTIPGGLRVEFITTA